LAALTPDVLFATTFPTVAALQQATRAEPIVFAGVIDPVGAGLVHKLGTAGRQDGRNAADAHEPQRMTIKSVLDGVRSAYESDRR
jgi:ABC-type uncharacterized transport system substrate-binding protein